MNEKVKRFLIWASFGVLFVAILIFVQYSYDTMVNPYKYDEVDITVAERYPSNGIIVTPENERYYTWNQTIFWNMRIGTTYKVAVKQRTTSGNPEKWIIWNILGVVEGDNGG